jgi:hypothetical protein
VFNIHLITLPSEEVLHSKTKHSIPCGVAFPLPCLETIHSKMLQEYWQVQSRNSTTWEFLSILCLIT